MVKGDIILISFPFTDLSGQKSRPSLVLHVDKGSNCIVTPISSVKDEKRHLFDILVKPSKLNGLKLDSLVKINNIATLDKKFTQGQMGKLEAHYVTEVNYKLKQLFKI